VKQGPNSDARLGALSLLSAVLERGENLAEAEPGPALADPRDRAYARHLAYGVLRWLNALEWLSGRLLERPLRNRDREVQRLLLIGLFQLAMDDTAPHAAVNECAESARKIGKPWAVGLVNAVLRRFQREQDQWLDRLRGRDESLAHPAWMLDALRQDWPDDWRGIVAANNQAAALWLRLSPRFDAAETIGLIAEAGLAVERHEQVPEAIRVSPAVSVTELPGFDQGRVFVQDPAAQLAAPLLDAQPGHRVLDACAAPGGKTVHILQRSPGVHLTALDRSARRLDRLHENLGRIGLEADGGIRVHAADAAEPAEWWDGVPFNRILLDAPCTSIGVIRRHPEIKWLRTPQQLEQACQLQERLLRRLWPLLEAGGILLYATCSALRRENGEQIMNFADRHPDAEPLEIAAEWGRKHGHGRQILPGEHDMDGFFYARLRKSH
jgi:16S rRNA (cytosine967-C5)-methyltransferase